MDIVCFGPVGNPNGAGQALPASSLPNFSSVPDGKQAKGACRKKNTLLHVASYEIDEGDLLELARAGGAIIFSLSDILGEQGFRRAILISKMRLLLAACRKRGASFVFCSLAKDAAHVRSARELTAFAAVLGATDVERKEAEKKIEELAKVGK